MGVDDNTTVMDGHTVQFYERDCDHVRAVTGFLLEGLELTETVVMVATGAHLEAFQSIFHAAGIDVDGLRHQGRIVALDARTTLSLFCNEGATDRDRFRSAVGGVLRRAAQSGRPVRVFGEMVALLWADGAIAEAIELEEWWNELGQEIPFQLLCGYPSQECSGPDEAEAVRDVCRLHSQVERQFVAALDAPGEARHFASDATRAHGHGQELADHAQLVVGELAANAIVHIGSPFTVAISSPDGALVISVHDVSPSLPMPRSAEPMAESGRGLGMVAAVASGWGAERTTAGKVVWAELRPEA